MWRIGQAGVTRLPMGGQSGHWSGADQLRTVGRPDRLTQPRCNFGPGPVSRKCWVREFVVIISVSECLELVFSVAKVNSAASHVAQTLVRKLDNVDSPQTPEQAPIK